LLYLASLAQLKPEERPAYPNYAEVCVMSESRSSFERDRDIARERYPKEMDRLETLRVGFDIDFPAALLHARSDGHLIRWHNGTHILAYDPPDSPVGFIVRIHTEAEQITDVGMVGQLNCPSFVEVRYERQEQAASQAGPTGPAPRTRTDCQQERPQTQHHYDPYAYFAGVGNYYGDPPAPPPGAIPLTEVHDPYSYWGRGGRRSDYNSELDRLRRQCQAPRSF
jgi:hypothetical protein